MARCRRSAARHPGRHRRTTSSPCGGRSRTENSGHRRPSRCRCGRRRQDPRHHPREGLRTHRARGAERGGPPHTGGATHAPHRGRAPGPAASSQRYHRVEPTLDDIDGRSPLDVIGRVGQLAALHDVTPEGTGGTVKTGLEQGQGGVSAVECAHALNMPKWLRGAGEWRAGRATSGAVGSVMTGNMRTLRGSCQPIVMTTRKRRGRGGRFPDRPTAVRHTDGRTGGLGLGLGLSGDPPTDR